MAPRWAADLLGALGSVLMPPLCPLCLARAPEEPAAFFCSPCRGRLRPLAEPWCPRCSLPFAGVGPSHPCPRCSAEPPPFRHLAAWGPYEGALLEAVRGFKYAGRLYLARGLEQLLVEAFDHAGLGRVPGLECAVPVPCSAQSLRRRGFDLPALLARSLARSRGLRWRPTALAKVEETPDLVGLGAEERRRAVARAYRPRESLSGAVVLVDDVATSTATARTCARACLRAGAGEVWVVTLARTALVS